MTTDDRAAARLGARLLDEDRPPTCPRCIGHGTYEGDPCRCCGGTGDRASNPFLRPPPTENQP